ncbi:MAG: YdcF family protein [Alphaproteobacteria bacterium]
MLFISGVGAEVTLPQMLAAHATPAQRAQIKSRGATIVLGHLASTTETNAEEVAAFARERQLKSIRLITAHYHMPRSLLEFRSLLPQVTFVPDAVFPGDAPREHWWQDGNPRG